MSAPKRSARKGLSQLIRDGVGAIAQHTFVPYYTPIKSINDDGCFGIACDPLLLAFVGKFGTRLLDEIMIETRKELWTEARVWDREQIVEKITRAINGGLPEVHRRLIDYPKLYDWLCARGFRHSPGCSPGMRGPQGVSVFRAIAYMSNPRYMPPLEIAQVLEEHRL